MMKDFRSSITFCERSIAAVAHVYEAESVELGREYLKLASLYFEILIQMHQDGAADTSSFTKTKTRAVEVVETAEKALLISAPEDVEDLEELREMKSILKSMP
jgi:hypothetical protein